MKNEINIQRLFGGTVSHGPSECTFEFHLNDQTKIANGTIYLPFKEANPLVQLFMKSSELLKENEQLKEYKRLNTIALSGYTPEDLHNRVTKLTDLNRNLEALNVGLTQMNNELLEALKQLRDTTRKINPEYWDLHTANALTYSDILIAKAEGKTLVGS